MAIEIREKFEVAAPIDKVWRFVMDPNKVAACMPGASLSLRTSTPLALEYLSMKCSASGLMSSRRSRKDGIGSEMTFRRK